MQNLFFSLISDICYSESVLTLNFTTRFLVEYMVTHTAVGNFVKLTNLDKFANF